MCLGSTLNLLPAYLQADKRGCSVAWSRFPTVMDAYLGRNVDHEI